MQTNLRDTSTVRLPLRSYLYSVLTPVPLVYLFDVAVGVVAKLDALLAIDKTRLLGEPTRTVVRVGKLCITQILVPRGSAERIHLVDRNSQPP